MTFRIAAAWLFLLCGQVLAEELVISGQVLDTASSKGNDVPIEGVVVEVRDLDSKLLGETTTGKSGMFHIKFDDRDVLKGKELIRVEASGYSAHPTTAQISLKRAPGMKLAFQGKFLLTNNQAIRDNAAYRDTVTQNAIKAQVEAGQEDSARMYFASFSSLPPESKDIAFNSIKRQSAPAFSELQKVDKEVLRTREMENELRQRGSSIVPSYDRTGKIRFMGAVTSENEMDAIIQQAGKKGFNKGAVINDMQIRKQ